MVDSTSDSQLNQGEVDYEFESNEVREFLTWCILRPLSVVEDQFVPKVGMTFTTLEDAGKVNRNYAKAAGFSIRVWSTNRKGNEIKNQLITCSREEKWKSKISQTAQGTKHVHSSYNRE
ncbi:Transposon protein [Arachis hypogaea]|nr:Transposon protein [Arachis hypogaea]